MNVMLCSVKSQTRELSRNAKWRSSCRRVSAHFHISKNTTHGDFFIEIKCSFKFREKNDVRECLKDSNFFWMSN